MFECRLLARRAKERKSCGIVSKPCCSTSQNRVSRVTEHASEGLSMGLAQMGCNMAIVEVVNTNDRAMLCRCLLTGLR